MRDRIVMGMVVVALVACARPPRPAVVPAAPRAAPSAAEPAPRAPEEPPGPPLPMITSDDFRDPDAVAIEKFLKEAESLEDDKLEGPGGIRVVSRWHPHTGTRHYAAELVITTPGGTLRFEEPPLDPASDTVEPGHPLMERIHAIGRDRWVLLGWSSYGEGMQAEHVWLVEDRGGPRVLDTLAWTTDRSHGGIAVEAASNQVRIGIPLPQLGDPDGPPTSSGEDDSDRSLHNPFWWELEHGKQKLSLDEVRKLPFSETHVMALRGFYDPPYQEEPSLRGWSGRFVWFSSGSKLVLDRHPRNDRPRPAHPER